MKSTSIFKKALIFAVVMVLSLVTVISVIPAFAAGETQGNTGETLKASNISISGEITMLYYFTGIDESTYGDNYYVRITVPKRNGDKNVIEIPVSKLKTDKKDNEERWIVPVSVAYAQQTTPFTIQFVKNGVEGKVRTRTVWDYADAVLRLADAAIEAEDNENKCIALAEPIKNMLNAGAMAQTYFNYTQYDMANEELYDEGTNPVNGMLTEHFYDVKGKPTQTVDSDYIKFLGGQALLDSAITLRIFVNCPDAVTSAQVSDGNVTKTVKLRVDDQGRKYVSINNIVATSFNTRYKVSITYADATVRYSYSVLDYAIDALESSIVSPEMKNVARALYLFYAQTTKYVCDTDDDPETNYVPGPKDENGAAADCNHARSYTKGEDLVCPDCGHTEKLANITKLDVSVVDTPEIIAGQNSDITLRFSLSGNSTPLTGILFTPKCDENVTFTLKSFTKGSDSVDVSANTNFLILGNNSTIADGVLVTATYTVKAPAGLHKVSIALREGTGESGEDVKLEGLITGIATFEAKATDCGAGNHSFTKYVNMSATKHIAICKTCGAQVEEDHAFKATTTENGDGTTTHKNACVCGNTKAFYVAKVLTTGTNEITLTANTASYSWVADNASSINIVCPELAVDYDLVLTNSNGTSVSMSADAYNGILSMYVLAGEVVDAKLVAQADTPAELDVQVYAGAEGEDLGHNVGVGVAPIDSTCLPTIKTDSVVLTNRTDVDGFRWAINCNEGHRDGQYIAITYEATDIASIDAHYYALVEDATGTNIGYGHTANGANTKVSGPTYDLINDGEEHVLIIDINAILKSQHKSGYTMTNLRFSTNEIVTKNTAITFKSVERCNDLALLEAKYGPEYGTAENPKPLKNIANFKVDLEAGDTDGYYYQYTVPSKGIYTFNTAGTNCAVTVTNTGDNTVFDNNGYVSISANAGDVLTINVKAIPSNDVYPAIKATIAGTTSDGSYGSNLTSSIVNATNTTQDTTAEYLTYVAAGAATGNQPKFNLSWSINNGGGRYLAITYKTNGFAQTDSYRFAAIHGETTIGISTNTYMNSKKVMFDCDDEWHTVIYDTYALMTGTANKGNGPTYNGFDGYTLTGFDLNFYKIATGSEITIKGVELGDDYALLMEKYGTDTTLEMSGVGFSRENIVGLKEVVDTDTGDFYVTNTTTSGDRSYYFTNGHTFPGRYIALTVKAADANSTISAIYLAGANKETGVAGTNLTAGQVKGTFDISSNVGKWVTIVIDIYDYIAEDEYVSTIRVDCCKVYTGTAKVYFKHLGVYETAEAALAAAEGSARVINMGVPTGE